jgi:hypothetical protein
MMFLIAIIENGKVEIKTVSTIPDKCLVLASWVEVQNV